MNDHTSEAGIEGLGTSGWRRVVRIARFAVARSLQDQIIEVAASLTAYVIVYAVVFTAGALFILRLMAEGPVAALAEPAPRQDRAPGSPLAKAPEDTSPGEGV